MECKIERWKNENRETENVVQDCTSLELTKTTFVP